MTAALAKLEEMSATLSERHALYLRIIGVHRIRFGENVATVWSTVDDASCAGSSSSCSGTPEGNYYFDCLADVLGDARLTATSAGVRFLCLSPRFPLEWR